MQHFMRIGSLGLLLALGLLSSAAAKAPRAAGSVTIATTSIAVGLGVNWGNGTLTIRGKRYTFQVQGLEVGAVGVSRVQAIGKVYHLGKVANFQGNYVAVTGDAAVGGGAGVLTMRNQHGVVVNLRSVQQGVKLTAGAEGILVKWKN